MQGEGSSVLKYKELDMCLALGLADTLLLLTLECGCQLFTLLVCPGSAYSLSFHANFFHFEGDLISGEKPVCTGRSVVVASGNANAVVGCHIGRLVCGCSCSTFC